MFSNHNGNKLKINSKRKLEKAEILVMHRYISPKSTGQKTFTMDIRKYFLLNDNEIAAFQDIWDATQCLEGNES